MGTWDYGPFDNDGAGDFVATLEDSPAGQWPDLLRRALDLPSGYLEVDGGQEAVAAAALVAASREADPRRSPFWCPYLDADLPALPADLVALARTALDTVTGEDSELQELWTENGPNPEWDAQVSALRAALR